MTFAAPLFLLAALAGLIPVVLHMINRQQAKDLPFPTLQFLRISVEKTRRRKRVHDVLLMILRAALLLLIAVGLSKPTLTSLASLLGRGGGNSAAAIILDNSASMGMMDQGRMRFDTALGAVDQILRELSDGDQVGLFLTCGPKFDEQDRLARNQDDIRQILGQVQVAYQRADLAVKIRQANKALSDCGAVNKQIYIITDQQSLSWDAMKKPEDSGDKATDSAGGSPAVPVIVVDCNRAPKPDVAVRNVVLDSTVPVAGMPVKASVEVFNASSVEQQRRVEIYVDGNKEGISPDLKIPAEGRMVHDFTFILQRGGLHRGEVRLAGEDGSKFNDRRFFTMNSNEGIPVAIVKPKRHEVAYLEDSFYLEQALAPARTGASALRTTPLTAGSLLGEPLEQYKVIFCVNLPALSDEVAERLKRFVSDGGSLVWVCGDNVDVDAYNRMNQSAGGELLPAALLDRRELKPQDQRDAWHVAFLDKQHPALRLLSEPASLYESILVTKHVRMDVSGGNDAWVLARLDDGEPLMVQRSVQKGRVVMLGTSAHVGWANLPLRNIFLPLAAQMTFYLSGSQQTRHETIAGAPIVLNLDDEARSVNIEVVPPSGETFRLNSKEEDGATGQVFRYADTHSPGIYMLRLLDAQRPTQFAYSVNLDPDESLPAKVVREELKERFGRTPLIFADDPDDLSSTFKWLREGKSLWEGFLLVVLLALVFECFISNRLSASKNDEMGKQLAAAAKPFARRRAGVFG